MSKFNILSGGGIEPALVRDFKANIKGLRPDPRKSVKAVVLHTIQSLRNFWVVDGVHLAMGDRVLVLDNGMKSLGPIYLVQHGDWVPVREHNVRPGTIFGVQEGNEHCGSLFVMGRDFVWRGFKPGSIKVGGQDGFELLQMHLHD